jgi:hypothetical protein
MYPEPQIARVKGAVKISLSQFDRASKIVYNKGFLPLSHVLLLDRAENRGIVTKKRNL